MQSFSQGHIYEGGNGQVNPLRLHQAQTNDNVTTVSQVTTHQLNGGNCWENIYEKKKRRGGRALNEKWTNSCTQLPQPPRYCSCHCLLKSDHKPEILRIQYARYVKGKKSMCRTLLWVAEMLSFVSWWPGNSGSLRTDGSKHSIPGSVDTNPILTYISYSSYTHIHNLIPALSFEHLNLFLARRSLNW